MSTFTDSLPTVSTEYAEISIESKHSEHAEEIEILHEVIQKQVELVLAAFCAGDLNPAVAEEMLAQREEIAPGERWVHFYSDTSDAETALLIRLGQGLEEYARTFVGDLLKSVAEVQRVASRSGQGEPDATETLRRLSA